MHRDLATMSTTATPDNVSASEVHFLVICPLLYRGEKQTIKSP